MVPEVHNNGLNIAFQELLQLFVSNFPLFLGGLAVQQRVCSTLSVLSPLIGK